MMNRDKIFGWVSPQLKFYPTEQYNHIEEVPNLPLSGDLLASVEDVIESLDGVADLCWGAEEDEGHGGWHDYEMAEDTANCEIRDLLIKAGWARVGTAYDGRVYVEAAPSTIQSRGAYIKAMFEDTAITFEPQDV